MDNSIKLNIPQYHVVSRSFSRKIQIENFEPAEAFSSHGEQIPLEEATPEKIKEVSERLFGLCKVDVARDLAIAVREAQIEKGESVVPTALEIAGIAEFIKELSDGGKDGVETVSKKIASKKDTMSEIQLAFLRQLALAIKNM